MAERRPPGFNVDLGFYDSEEVLSIPRKIRAAAIGVWTLCGAYSANKLNDGYVHAEALRDRGCTPAIRAALMSTTPEPLWVDADDDGGIWFTRWDKWQRTAAEIKAYREAEAARKRKSREAKKQARGDHVSDTYSPRGDHVSDTWRPDEPHVVGDMSDTCGPHTNNGNAVTSVNSETSGRTSAGHPQVVRPEDRDPKTETETETETEEHVPLLVGGCGGELEKPKPRRKAPRTQLQDDWHPAPEAIQRMRAQYPHLDLKAECQAFTNHHQAHGNVMADWTKAFWTWLGNTNKFGPNDKPARNVYGKPPHKMRVLAELAQTVRAAENAHQLTTADLKELQ